MRWDSSENSFLGNTEKIASVYDVDLLHGGRLTSLPRCKSNTRAKIHRHINFITIDLLTGLEAGFRVKR